LRNLAPSLVLLAPAEHPVVTELHRTAEEDVLVPCAAQAGVRRARGARWLAARRAVGGLADEPVGTELHRRQPAVNGTDAVASGSSASATRASKGVARAGCAVEAAFGLPPLRHTAPDLVDRELSGTPSVTESGPAGHAWVGASSGSPDIRIAWSDGKQIASRARGRRRRPRAASPQGLLPTDFGWTRRRLARCGQGGSGSPEC
jgi:hypothetical protein